MQLHCVSYFGQQGHTLTLGVFDNGFDQGGVLTLGVFDDGLDQGGVLGGPLCDGQHIVRELTLLRETILHTRLER